MLVSFLQQSTTMSRLSLAFSMSMAALAIMPTAVLVSALNTNGVNTRRAFVAKVPGIVGSAAAMGWLINLEDQHASDCQCSQCAAHDSSCQCSSCVSHGAACQCGSCASFFRPAPAAAYERDVGGADRSAESAAYNIQARLTNARLEKEGFKLDTKEEEAARLSEAMASFSYSPTTTGKQAGTSGFGGNKTRPSEKK